MQSLTKALLLPVIVGALSGCGSALSSDLFGTTTSQVAKTPCPGSHQGFYVCMSSDSSISDAAVAQAIQQGLTQLIQLVNSASFDSQVTNAFTSGSGIAQTLTGTDYVVQITGYCDASTNVLANAIVGGMTINYNECLVQRDAAGQIDQASVTGVLLHEISHNIGYTHPAVDPSRSTVPYYLGDLAQSDLDSSLAPGSGTAPGTTSAWQKSFND